MKIVLTVIGVLLILIFIVIFTRLTVDVQYVRDDENDGLRVRFKAWFGLLRYHINIPAVELKGWFSGVTVEQEQGVSEEKEKKRKRRFGPQQLREWLLSYRQTLHHIHNVKRIIHRFLKHVKLTEWIWHSRIGMKDAADTGMVTGAAWGVKSMITGFLCHRVRLCTRPSFDVEPFYYQNIFHTRFRCIIQFRVGYAIITGIRMLLNTKKGRDPLWQTTQSKA